MLGREDCYVRWSRDPSWVTFPVSGVALRASSAVRLLLSLSVATGCLDSTGPAPLPPVNGPLVELGCPDAVATSLSPNLMWIPSDSVMRQHVTITLVRMSLTPAACTVDSSNFALYRVHPIFDSITAIADTEYRFTMRSAAPGRTIMYFALNGHVLSTVDVLEASRAFAAAAIGHRGAGNRYPENTLVAMRAGVEADLAASEMDVQLTKDTVAVLMHDPTVNRTTNGTGPLADLTAAQVLSLDAGFKFGKMFIGEHVPTLAQVLTTTAASGHYLYVEGKPQSVISMAAFASLMVQIVRAAGAESRVTLTSVSTDFLQAARAASSTIGLSLEDRSYRAWHQAFCKQIRATAILYFEPDSLVLPQLLPEIDSLESAGVHVIASTTDRPSLADSILNLTPIRRILTDYPPGVYALGKVFPPDSLP